MSRIISISVQDLFFSFGAHSLIEKGSFSLFHGEFVGVIGPNGSGKTTLLKLMMGFLSPKSGEILLLGKTPLISRQDIAYVPQHLNFDRKFPITLLQMVLTGLIRQSRWFGSFTKEEKEKATQVLCLLGLEKQKLQSLGTLSGGQLQRGLIARALLSDPKILFLDEPTASVDQETTLRIYQLLNDLKGKMTMVMVTHQIDKMVDSLDKVLCLNRQIDVLLPQQVCHHHALGLYHQPFFNRGSP